VSLMWNNPELQELWTLTAEELELLPGMTEKGRLAFALQLKFMELHGRFPEHHGEVDPTAVMWVASQLGITGSVTGTPYNKTSF